MPAPASVRPVIAEPSKNIRNQIGWAWRLGIAESKAATWITRNATSDNNQTSQTLTRK